MIAILTANLGNFDKLVEPVKQNIETIQQIWTDVNFPPITGLTPRMQYRIPKTHGWQMFLGHDKYIWLDGSMSLQQADSAQWFDQQLGDADMALFKHPWRRTVLEEISHIEEHLRAGKPYITARYKNGLHLEQYLAMLEDKTWVDDRLFTSTAFIYRNTEKVQEALKDWWYYGARYFTCDQVVLPYIVHKHQLKVNIINANQYKIPHLSLVSNHS